MKVHWQYKGLNLDNPVVTMGIFDGVHMGHRSLIEALVKLSSAAGRESAVITFNPHPRHVLDPSSANPLLLTTVTEKIRLIGELGVDHLIIISFDHDFSRIKACDFVAGILVGEIGTSHLVVGYDHHFGYMAEGNYDTITGCAGLMNFRVEKIAGLDAEGGMISSSMIREKLASGDIENANRLLGYNYLLNGKVIEGKMIGREMGFPTANIEPSDRLKLIPASGVYAVEVIVGSVKYKGMLSIGTNPTVDPGRTSLSVEVNIFDFSGNIYGAEIDILFRFRMRDEMKFPGRAELTERMKADMMTAKKLLN